MQVKKQQLEPDVEQLTGSKLGKEYIKAVCRHPVDLISLNSFLPVKYNIQVSKSTAN